MGLIVYLCDREPLSNLIVLYLLALIGAAQSLSVPWILGYGGRSGCRPKYDRDLASPSRQPCVNDLCLHSFCSLQVR